MQELFTAIPGSVNVLFSRCRQSCECMGRAVVTMILSSRTSLWPLTPRAGTLSSAAAILGKSSVPSWRPGAPDRVSALCDHRILLVDQLWCRRRFFTFVAVTCRLRNASWVVCGTGWTPDLNHCHVQRKWYWMSHLGIRWGRHVTLCQRAGWTASGWVLCIVDECLILPSAFQLGIYHPATLILNVGSIAQMKVALFSLLMHMLVCMCSLIRVAH